MRRLLLACFIAIAAFATLSGSPQSHAQTADPTATPDTGVVEDKVTFSSNVRVVATRNWNTGSDYQLVQDGDRWYVEKTGTHDRTPLPAGIKSPYDIATPDSNYLLIFPDPMNRIYSFDVLHKTIIDLGDPFSNVAPEEFVSTRQIEFEWADVHQFVMMYRDMPEWSWTFAIVGDASHPNSVKMLKSLRSIPTLRFNPPRLEKWDTPYNPAEDSREPNIFDAAGNVDCLQTVYNFHSETTEVRHYKAFCYPDVVRPDGVAYYGLSIRRNGYDDPIEVHLATIMRFDPATGMAKAVYSGSFDGLIWVSPDEHTALVTKYGQGGQDKLIPYNLIDLDKQTIIKTFSTEATFTGDTLADGRLIITHEIADPRLRRTQYLLFDLRTTIQTPLFDITRVGCDPTIRAINGSVITGLYPYSRHEKKDRIS